MSLWHEKRSFVTLLRSGLRKRGRASAGALALDAFGRTLLGLRPWGRPADASGSAEKATLMRACGAKFAWGLGSSRVMSRSESLESESQSWVSPGTAQKWVFAARGALHNGLRAAPNR